MKLFGSHINSNINNLNKEINKIKDYGGNLVQFFINIRNNNKDYDFLKKENIKIVIHASYTINIAQEWNEHSWWLKQFLLEIEMAEYIGAFGIVIHLGKQLKLSSQEGLNNMYTSILYIYDKIKNLNIKIFFETSTGQGSEMCYNLEDFAYFFNKFLKINQDKFRICLDTCHIFQAGYDISTIDNINLYLKDFERLIGLKYIGLIHLNDSKNSLGSKLDRHENLGFGHIGKENLLYISNFFMKSNVPIVLETPDNSKVKQEINKYFIQNNKNITNIYFDWSGTLARSGTKEIFVDENKTTKEKLDTLYDDTKDVLEYLNKKNYKVGIITNTSQSNELFKKSLKETKLEKYFEGNIVFSNEPNMCKKSCKKIFSTAMKRDKVDFNNSVMIGNSYEKDIKGGKSAKMFTIFVEREKLNKKPTHADITIKDLIELKKYF